MRAELETERAAHLATQEALKAALARQKADAFELAPSGESPVSALGGDTNHPMTGSTTSRLRAPPQAQTQEVNVDGLNEADAKLTALENELKELNAQLESKTRALEELTTAKEAADRATEDAAHERDGHRAELKTTRAENQALLLELGALKNDVISLRARKHELEPMAEQLATLQQQAHQEREKAQGLAAKLLENRSHIRELESALHTTRAQVTELEAGKAQHDKAWAEKLEAAAQEHQNALHALQAENDATLAQERTAHLKVVETYEVQLGAERDAAAANLFRENSVLGARIKGLEEQLIQAGAQISHAQAEYQHANTQYAQLHREMLTLLDQRDDALRELAQHQKAQTPESEPMG